MSNYAGDKVKIDRENHTVTFSAAKFKKITGTRLASIVDRNEYCSEFEVACDICKLFKEDIDNKFTRAGTAIEPKIRDYVRAFNHKIIPIFLTVSSTIVGLVPFFMDGKDEPFWFSFATGVTGGLLFSLPALIFIMPIFCKFGEKGKR